MIERNSAQIDLKALSSPAQSGAPSQLDLAMERIKAILSDSLQHGFFQCQISTTIGPNKRRELLIHSGKIQKFTIPVEDLSRG